MAAQILITLDETGGASLQSPLTPDATILVLLKLQHQLLQQSLAPQPRTPGIVRGRLLPMPPNGQG